MDWIKIPLYEKNTGLPTFLTPGAAGKRPQTEEFMRPQERSAGVFGLEVSDIDM